MALSHDIIAQEIMENFLVQITNELFLSEKQSYCKNRGQVLYCPCCCCFISPSLEEPPIFTPCCWQFSKMPWRDLNIRSPSTRFTPWSLVPMHRKFKTKCKYSYYWGTLEWPLLLLIWLAEIAAKKTRFSYIRVTFRSVCLHIDPV